MTEHNIDYLDISDKLRKIPKINFEIGPHYTTKGNRAIADFIKEHIFIQHKDKMSGFQN